VRITTGIGCGIRVLAALMSMSGFSLLHAAEVSAPAREPITMWFWGASPADRKALQEALIEPFNRSQSRYRLVIEYRTSVDNDVRIAAIAPVLDTCRQFGHLVCVPPSLCVNGMFYNAAVLAANGWQVPRTRAEVEAIMRAAQRRGMYGSVTGNAGWEPVNEDYVSVFLNQIAGPRLLREVLSGRAAWTAPPMQEAMNELNRWYRAGFLGGNDYFVLNFDSSLSLLHQRRAPFFFAPVFAFQWATAYFQGAEANDLRFAPFPNMNPALPYPLFDVGSAFSLSINAHSHVKDGAAAVLNWIMSRQFVLAISRQWPGYWAIPLVDFPQDPQATGVTRMYYEAMGQITEAVRRGAYGYNVDAYFPDVTKALLGQDLEAVWLGQETSDQMLQRAGRALARERSRGATLSDIPLPDFKEKP
jgi:raffinose/stachyose/melibiose transport system substrate-binding protein